LILKLRLHFGLVNDVHKVQVERGGIFQKVNMDYVTTPLRDFVMPDPNFVHSSIVRPHI